MSSSYNPTNPPEDKTKDIYTVNAKVCDTIVLAVAIAVAVAAVVLLL